MYQGLETTGGYIVQDENTPLIDKVYCATVPAGRYVQINRFDYNLTLIADKTKYVQTSCGGWITCEKLTILHSWTPECGCVYAEAI